MTSGVVCHKYALICKPSPGSHIGKKLGSIVLTRFGYQGNYHGQCEACGEEQIVTAGQIRFSKARPCRKCGK